MAKKLTPGQIEGYTSDGYICPVDVFPRAQALAYGARLAAFEAAHGFELGKGHNFKPHLLFTWVDEIVHHPAVLDAVEDLIGPDIRLFHLSVWPKNAHDAAFVPWHQDATYFGLEPAVQVTAWVALTDAPIESGCMEVMPGSHKAGQRHHHTDPSPHNLLSRGQTVSKVPDTPGTAFMPVSAGQMSMHHTYIMHRSGPNATDHRRVGLGISYIPTSVRCRSATRLTAMLVRGTDRYGHFDPERRPLEDYGAAERAFHEQAVALFRQSNTEQAAHYPDRPAAE
ncbi:MAG TPA: phytanoyl-CoA dioxygenase family protein [Vineibacter sp.]|nr:phytanoyl-CoA dioxygenase family protein [Vineibacter sp.]